MHTRIRFPGVVLLALGLHGFLLAQSAPDLQALTDALKLRSDMADNIVKGLEKPDAVIGRLQAQASPSGLKIDRDADFAFAAIDVGQRLIPKGKPAEAERFFQEAEKALDTAITKTADTQPRDKAMLLQKQALLRGLYLNKVTQAMADIEQAIALQPDDKYLPQFRASLANEKAEFVKDKPKG